MQGGQSLAERYSRLAQETPDRRRVDFELRALDIILSTLFLVVSLPIAAMIGSGSCSPRAGRSSTAASVGRGAASSR